MTSLRKFVIGITISFGLPWLILIVVPAISAQKLSTLAYDKERDGIDGVYPGTGIYRQGQLIYAKEGCTQCHTQMIRPGFAGMIDPWKKGWGSDQTPIPSQPTRESTQRDYMYEPYAFLGVQRNGPDLTNVGYRLADKSRAEIHAHLYSPQSVNKWSIMPSFRHLYKLQPIQGNGSPKALQLSADFMPLKGFEVVPSAEAEELVTYLLSLKKDAPLPGHVVAETTAKK
jgi:cytochrome c oxidase cbb3-type subunit II